jgi:hypothetical protein
MDRRPPRNVDRRETRLAADRQARAAGYLAVDRETQELRRERDRLMLDLAARLGPAGLAEHMGVRPDAVTKLLARAHERLSLPPAGGDFRQPAITARRLRAGDGRWARADALYAALGRASS